MINFSQVVFGYNENEKVLQDVNLDLSKGSINGLFGKNGAGKTTALKLSSGLLFPQEGEISVLEQPIAYRGAELLQEIVYVPEEPFFPAVTGERFLTLYAPFYPKFDIDEFHKNLSDFGFHGNKQLSDLSYGQKKKFILSFSLAANTEIVLFDEPTNGLDIPGKKIFRKVLGKYFNERKIFIIATHQIREIESLIDTVIIIDENRVAFNKNIDEISRFLSIKIEGEAPENTGVYYEKVIGGYAILEKNRDKSEKRIDIEFLFNAVTNDPNHIEKLFAENNNKKGDDA